MLFAGATFAQPRTLRTIPNDDKNVVQFVSEATLERIVGRTADIRGSVELNSSQLMATTEGKFTVDLRTIDTGIGLRNQHMRENHLDTDEFPEATFTLQKVISANREELLPGESVTMLVEGDFAIHGINKTYQIPLTLTYYPNATAEAGRRLYGGTGDLVEVVGEWTVKLADHNISRPEFLFMRLAEEQIVSVAFALTDVPPPGRKAETKN